MLDAICMSFALAAVSFCVFYGKGRINVELLSFQLQLLGEVIKFFSFTFRMICEIENNFTSAQRLYKYTLLEPEDELTKPYDDEIINKDKHWPNQG